MICIYEGFLEVANVIQVSDVFWAGSWVVWQNYLSEHIFRPDGDRKLCFGTNIKCIWSYIIYLYVYLK